MEDNPFVRPLVQLPLPIAAPIMAALLAVSFARPRLGMLIVIGTVPLQRFVLIPTFIGNRFTAAEFALLGALLGNLARRDVKLSPPWSGPIARPYLLLLVVGLLSLLQSDFVSDGVVEVLILAYVFFAYRVAADFVTAPGMFLPAIRVWRGTVLAFSALAAAAVFLDLAGVETYTMESERFYGTFFNANQAGSFFIIGMFLPLASALGKRGPLRARWRSLAGFGAAAVGIFFTGSRASLLGAAAGGLLLLVLKRVRVSVIAAFAVFALLGQTGIRYFRAHFGGEAQFYDDRYSEGLTFESPDARERLDNWRTGLQAFEDRPLLGVGLGVIGNYTAAGGGQEWATQGEMVHNTYVSFLGETGVIGFALLLAVLWAMAREARGCLAATRGTPWEDTAQGLVAGLAGEAVFNLFHFGLHARHLWITLALVTSLRKLCGRRSASAAAASTRARAAVVRPALGAS